MNEKLKEVLDQYELLLDSKNSEYERVKHYNDSPSTIRLAAEIGLLKEMILIIKE